MGGIALLFTLDNNDNNNNRYAQGISGVVGISVGPALTVSGIVLLSLGLASKVIKT